MERTYIKDLKDHVGKEAVIKGWIDTRRNQGKMVFFDFRDVSGKVQGVVLPMHAEALEAAKEVPKESKTDSISYFHGDRCNHWFD